MNWKRKLAWTGAAPLLITLAALAGPAGAQSPSPAEVTVDISPDRQSLGKNDDVLVTVTLSNRSATVQYLLAWQTPLAGVQAPLFEVTRDGQPVPYLGIQAKRRAASAGDYIALAPGASRSVKVELSSLYDMRVTGAYSVRYRQDSLQLYSAPGVLRAAATLPDYASTIWIDGRLPRGTLPGARVPVGPAGLSYSHCSNAQQASIANAVQAAQAMTADGNTYMANKALGPRYATWFGAFDGARATAIINHFHAIGDAFADKPVTVDCGCADAYYAYVYPSQPYTIYVCNAFWSAPMTGTDSKGGTLVHEMSHFTVVAGTNDWVYGQPAAASLAQSDPARAVDNADSHEYFGENTPHEDIRR